MSRRRHFVGTKGSDLADNDIEFAARYFASAGSVCDYENRPPGIYWLPWAWGSELRDYWCAARDRVRRLVPPRAFDLMEKYLDRTEAAQFDDWPHAAKREIYGLCAPTGCAWRISPKGHTEYRRD